MFHCGSFHSLCRTIRVGRKVVASNCADRNGDDVRTGVTRVARGTVFTAADGTGCPPATTTPFAEVTIAVDVTTAVRRAIGDDVTASLGLAMTFGRFSPSSRCLELCVAKMKDALASCCRTADGLAALGGGFAREPAEMLLGTLIEGVAEDPPPLPPRRPGLACFVPLDCCWLVLLPVADGDL